LLSLPESEKVIAIFLCLQGFSMDLSISAKTAVFQAKMDELTVHDDYELFYMLQGEGRLPCSQPDFRLAGCRYAAAGATPPYAQSGSRKNIHP
jgi:hypothetical protein